MKPQAQLKVETEPSTTPPFPLAGQRLLRTGPEQDPVTHAAYMPGRSHSGACLTDLWGSGSQVPERPPVHQFPVFPNKLKYMDALFVVV